MEELFGLGFWVAYQIVFVKVVASVAVPFQGFFGEKKKIKNDGACSEEGKEIKSLLALIAFVRLGSDKGMSGNDV